MTAFTPCTLHRAAAVGKRMVAGDEGQSSVQLSAAQSDKTVTFSDSAIWTPYIKGLVEDHEVSVFLDTGAGLSLISEALRQRIPTLKHRPLLKSFQVAHTDRTTIRHFRFITCHITSWVTHIQHKRVCCKRL